MIVVHDVCEICGTQLMFFGVPEGPIRCKGCTEKTPDQESEGG